MTLQELNSLIQKAVYESCKNGVYSTALKEKSVPQPYNRYNAREMTKSQIEKRDVVGNKLLNNKKAVKYFKDNYGEDWESWLWATATNIVMKQE